MTSKPRVLFWINVFHLQYALAYHLQSQLNADFFGLIDIVSKPKKFFQTQNLVEFKKIWFYHDHIKKIDQKPDLDYLNNFEKTHGINLWESALNERFFYKFNRFYQFTKEEILSHLEQEIKFFESVLDEVKPDYFVTYNPVHHHQKLLLDICRAKGIKVLSACRTGINEQTLLVENGSTFDLNLDQSLGDYYNKNPSENEKENVSDVAQRDWIQKRNVTFSDKLIALKDFLLDSDTELIKSNFMYYGRTKFKVVKDALCIEYKKNRNYNFLNKFSIHSPPLDVPFVYFPMNIVEEASLLHYAPYFTDQIEVIRHIAKSIPIDYILYVKEHVAARLRSWNDVNYYKEIMEIPNVKLIHPKFDSDSLIKKSGLVIAIRGTTTVKAVKFGKPSITFGKQPYQIIPSVFGVESLSSLPELIKEALECKTSSIDYKKFDEFIDLNAYEFPVQDFEVLRNQILLSGNGAFSNVTISKEKMLDFLKKTQEMLSESVKVHAKIISSN
mgnify:FL=1|jgi:hypothetical protein|tara:strand:+ start:6853 stop:8349 length:1497 start_codon:yes stop_codon:yes gene_type:complete